jgi:hypothetical protein
VTVLVRTTFKRHDRGAHGAAGQAGAGVRLERCEV